MHSPLAFIFNCCIDSELSCPHDFTILVPALRDRGFEVRHRKIHTLKDFLWQLEQAGTENYSNRHSLWVFVLARGSQGKLLIGGRSISTEYIFEPFSKYKCPSLNKKPKIFAIQTWDDQDLKLQPDFLGTLDLCKSASFNVNIPKQANTLVFYSPFASKCVNDGNICFIKEFCKNLKVEKDVEITEILSSVMLSIQKGSQDYCTGVPGIYSTMLQKFYLKYVPKIEV